MYSNYSRVYVYKASLSGPMKLCFRTINSGVSHIITVPQERAKLQDRAIKDKLASLNFCFITYSIWNFLGHVLFFFTVLYFHSKHYFSASNGLKVYSGSSNVNYE